VIRYPGKLKLSTITDPFKGISPELNSVEVSLLFNRRFGKFVAPFGKGLANLLPLRTAGPNSKVSFLGAPLDAYIMHKKFSHLLENIRTLCAFSESNIYQILLKEYETVKGFIDEEESFGKGLRMGKLSLKEEAAGKIRVFAIADV